MNVLTMQDVRKSFGSLEVLKGISLTVGEGEAVSVIGPSGSGKSTLLRCATLLETMDGGSLAYGNDFAASMDADGKSVYADKAALRRIKSRFGLVFQQFNLFPHYTVLKNVTDAPLTVQKRERGEVRELALSLLEKMGLADKADAYPCQLSGGQQQRVALARILCSEPQAILLDEPFSALDSYLKWNLELELSDLLAGFRGPILWVSHDLGECCRNCQKVCVMENGVSSPVTDMETLVRHPATQSAARLTGCRNFLPARRCEGGVRLDGWDILLPLHAVGERATVAVPDGAITVEGGTHTARVSRVIRDLNATAVVLRAAEAPDAPPLRVVLPEGVRAAEGDTLSFSLLADRCRLWEE